MRTVHHFNGIALPQISVLGALSYGHYPTFFQRDHNLLALTQVIAS
ncbi:MAG: hypothetical protein J6386_14010 [Candidatus Synoicihabitans palmerolidicus]|nr:hypothetical protein [Candidatus Synoicihabitans palmerolidicus]